jgi:lyso-ornithine lipid O-acyltransferase
MTTAFFVFMQGWIRVFWRFFYFIVSTITHIAGYALHILKGRSKSEAAILFRRNWLSHVPESMGFNITSVGKPYTGPCLFVANHISYIDPFVILLHADARVVSKAEVLKWPLVGLAGSLAGTIYVNRNKKSSRANTANAIQDALEHQISILVFPEGTTTEGNTVLPFRPRSFQAADFAGVPVQPIAIKYEASQVPFIGRDTFIPHFFHLFRLRKINGKIIFGPLMKGPDACRLSHEWIEEQVCSKSLQPVS